MSRSLSLLPSAALAALIFLAWMHPAVLDPRNVGWLLDGEDRGQSATGLAAYLRAGGPWPSLHQPLLSAPEGMTLLFTDSIPLLGLLLAPVAFLLPPQAQFIGLWYLACVALQVGFAHALVRRHAPDAPTAWLATALLAAMPALLNRYGHASLCAQWLILWALWVFVDEARARSAWWWVAVLGVAALVHSYLLLMVASIWGSAMLRILWRGPDRSRAFAGGAGVVALVAAIAWWHGVFAGPYLSTGTYGAFPLALDAWWNPANPDFSALVPSSPQRFGKGFEGFQYLGAGLLALAAVAVLRRRGSGEGLAWLVPAFLVIAVVGIGPQPIWRGQALFALHLPRGIVDALDPIRAAGRLAWPITYTIAYLAIVGAMRLPRAPLVLGAALALQIVDLAPMLDAVRATSAGAEDRRVYRRTLDPRWQAMVAGASAIEFEPAEPYRDLQLMEEVAWRAVAACRPVRYFYASREGAATRARVEADHAAFAAGRIDPTRLHVLLDGRVPPPLAGRAIRIDGATVIPPSAAAPPPRCR